MISRLSRAALITLTAIVPAPAAWSVASGDAAPACSAPLLASGQTASLADYRGKVVYLDFWASWCAPCRESFPFMNELQAELADKGLQIVAVSVDKTAEEAQRFLTRYPAKFTIALDTKGTCPAAFRIEGMPSSYIIDRTGTVRAVHAGFRDSDRAEIRRQVTEILNGGRQ
jgi:thiol-disulfide isomerase/thioredoxin